MTGAAKRVVLEGLGWLLLLVGLAAFFLPGPGLLAMFAGLALLSRQYAWARRYVEPVRLRALLGAADGVATWPRLMLSMVGVIGLVACGVLWIWHPPAPEWWTLAKSWWLPGDLWTGITQIGSGLIAFAMIVYSFRRFRGNPREVADLRAQIKGADADMKRSTAA